MSSENEMNVNDSAIVMEHMAEKLKDNAFFSMFAQSIINNVVMTETTKQYSAR